jgi:hypothetical protein
LNQMCLKMKSIKPLTCMSLRQLDSFFGVCGEPKSRRRPFRFISLLGILFGMTGCLQHGKDADMVPADPFGKPLPVPARKANFAPAPTDVFMRVDLAGRKIMAANPEIGLRPTFAAIGSPSPEIFHQGTAILWITAGLVNQCKTEAALAAVLSEELGKMVSEREAMASRKARDPDRLPPLEVPIGQAGNYGSSADLTHMAEMGKFERMHPPRRNLPPPDPHALAVRYLEKAGYQKADLDLVRPLLDAAEKNCALEWQLAGPPGAKR